MYTSLTIKIAEIIHKDTFIWFKEFIWLIKSHSAVASKRQTCLGYICKFGMCHEIIPGSSNGGFSVVKHLYSLEIALYRYKELRRNVLDFWSRFQTEKPPKTAHFTIACTICDLHKKTDRIPKRAGRPSGGTFKFYRVTDWPIRSAFFVSTKNK